MDLQRILARVRLLTDDAREALLTTLCADAARELEGKLLCSEQERETYAEALCAAAAAKAVYQLALIDAAQAPDSLTAGDVRAEFKTNCTQARIYLAQCMQAVSPILRDDTFYFGGVRACRK